MDVTNLKAIQKEFGSRKLKKYPTINFWDLYFVYPFIKKIHQVRPLNFIRYNKIEASYELENRIESEKKSTECYKCNVIDGKLKAITLEYKKNMDLALMAEIEIE